MIDRVVATVAIRPMATRNPFGQSSSGMDLKFMPNMPEINVAGMKMMATTVSARTSWLTRLLAAER
jgi:hypothetical protein